MVEGLLMTTIRDVLDRYRQQPSPPEGTTSNPFKLTSTLDEPAAATEVDEAWNRNELARDAVDLWAACRAARLFEDVDYGQWGLVLLSPRASATRTAQEREARPSDFRSDDVVIGEFLGDQELLVLAPSETGRRKVLIALPLDRRDDWIGAASDLGEFLDRYFHGRGDKYWERQDVEDR
jgi:hypothetical protein